MFKLKPDGVCGMHNMTRRASAKSRLIGENIQVLVAGGVPLVRALEASLNKCERNPLPSGMGSANALRYTGLAYIM